MTALQPRVLRQEDWAKKQEVIRLKGELMDDVCFMTLPYPIEDEVVVVDMRGVPSLSAIDLPNGETIILVRSEDR